MDKSKILLLLGLFVFIGGCTSQTQSLPLNENAVLVTYEIADEQRPDDFARWQAMNEQRVALDRWDATVEDVNHELVIDIDVSDDFVECNESIEVTVDVENKGDETENLRVQLTEDRLFDEEKFVEVEPGHVRSVAFDVDTKTPEGRYTFEARVFRDVKFDRDFNVRDGGEFEASDSKSIFIATCRD